VTVIAAAPDVGFENEFENHDISKIGLEQTAVRGGSVFAGINTSWAEEFPET
jgi:hypothetical protein